MNENFEKLPESLKDFLKIIQTEIPSLISDIFVGVYIYGSISYGDFAEKRSDVDIMVVTKRKFINEEFQKIFNWFKNDSIVSNRWLKKLELDFLILDDVLGIKNNVETVRFAGGELKRLAEFDGLAMDLNNLRSCGIVLCGEDPKVFIPEIDEKFLFEALVDKFDSLKKNIFVWAKIDLWNQVYIVVQLCRVVFAIKNNHAPVSKKVATEWCKNNLPNQFQTMISTVLSKMENFSGPREKVIEENLSNFVDYVDGFLKGRKGN